MIHISDNNSLGIFKEIEVTREFELEQSLSPSDAKIFKIFSSLWIINPVYSAKYLNYHPELGIWFNSNQGERSLEAFPLKVHEILQKSHQSEKLSHLIDQCGEYLNSNISFLPSLEKEIRLVFRQVFQVKPHLIEASNLFVSPVEGKKEFLILLQAFLSQKLPQSSQLSFDHIAESWYSISMTFDCNSFHNVLINFSPFEIFICSNGNSFERKKPKKYSIFLKILLDLVRGSKPLSFQINSHWFEESEKIFHEGFRLPAPDIWIPFMKEKIVDFFLKIFKSKSSRLDPTLLDEIPLHSGYKNAIIFALNHSETSMQIRIHPNIITPIMALVNGMQVDDNLTLFTRCKNRQIFFILPNGHEIFLEIPVESKHKQSKDWNNPLRMSILQAHTVSSIFFVFQRSFSLKIL